jgi:predicted RNase H-related nuclease YkuK (DUF458 family)
MNWKRAGKKIEGSLIEYLDNLIKTEKGENQVWRVSVGTDSQKDGRYEYKFATVILITVKEDLGGGVLIGRGGKIIESTYKMKVHAVNKEGVNERMLIEVGKSIETAYEISPVLDKYGIKMEIHADINADPKWESNKALSQAVGYILGMGYDFKIKPDAWAASYGGDKYAH